MSDRTPSRRELLRPLELIAFAAGLGVFTGLVVLISVRSWTMGGIGFGVAFIVGLVGLAMFALTTKNDDEPGSDGEPPAEPSDQSR